VRKVLETTTGADKRNHKGEAFNGPLDRAGKTKDILKRGGRSDPVTNEEKSSREPIRRKRGLEI